MYVCVYIYIYIYYLNIKHNNQTQQTIFSTQEDVYTAMGTQIVESATNGYNCCLCAYGQTGTGKTHTIHGDWQSKEIHNSVCVCVYMYVCVYIYIYIYI